MVEEKKMKKSLDFFVNMFYTLIHGEEDKCTGIS